MFGYRPLPEDGESDIAAYNKELEARGNPTWINVFWLFAECYLCRVLIFLFLGEEGIC
jgi:hypothetical protein